MARNRSFPTRFPCFRVVTVALVACAGVTVLDAGATQAQTPEREPAVLELAPGARALGLGLAPQLGADDPDLAFVHPALATGLSGFHIGTSLFRGGGTGYSLSAATDDWFGGGVAASIQTLEYLSSGAGLRPGGLDPLFDGDGSGQGVSETAATLTYARALFGVDVGVSGRVSTQRFDGSSVTTAMADVGAALPIGPLTAALSVRNLGREPELAGETLRLPTEVVLGVGGYGRQVGPLDMGLAAQVIRRDDGEFLYGGGLEVGYWPIRGRTFVGRVGFRNIPEGDASPVTFGGSFWGDDLVLEYAFQPVSGEDGLHRITVGWR
jgi:hypothetical protein